MFRKLLGVLLSLFLPLLLNPQLALAVSTGGSDMPAIYPIPKPNPTTFLGQAHDYSVVFRGNGEAVISLKVAFTNSTEDKKDNFELRLPLKIQPSEMLAFQVTKEPPCTQYAPYPTKIQMNYVPVCEVYGEADYFQPYYGTNLYQKAETSLDGDTLKIKFPKAIDKDKSGSFFVYFRAMGMASKDIFGAYNFNFETARVNESIQRLDIGISTDADQFLKGATGTVDYRFDQAAGSLAPMATGEAAKNAQVDQFYNQIGYGTIVKNVSNLAALESYKVNGAYADSKLKLYGKEIAIGLGILAATVLVIFLLVKIVLSKVKKTDDKVEVSPSTNMPSGGRNLLLSFGASLIGVVVTALYSFGLIALTQVLEQSYIYQSGQFLMLILVVISFVVYVMAIVIPGVLVGIKKGAGWGVLASVLTLVWLIIIMILIGFYLFFTNKTPGVIRPYVVTESTGQKVLPPGDVAQ